MLKPSAQSNEYDDFLIHMECNFKGEMEEDVFGHFNLRTHIECDDDAYEMADYYASISIHALI